MSMSMSVSAYIYIAHNCEISNVLYALVRSERKRFQMLSECISVNSRIAQVVQQIIPHHRTNHRKSLLGGGA